MAGPNATLRTLLSAEQIARRVEEMGRQITEEYAGESLVLLGVLKGCNPFLADLARAIDLPQRIDYIQVASWHGKRQQTGAVQFKRDHEVPIDGEHVILVEDIVDTGLTLHYLRQLLTDRNPASLRVCTLLDKHEARVHPVQVDYIGFPIPNQFVVGYGLDDDEWYRNLPYVAVVE